MKGIFFFNELTTKGILNPLFVQFRNDLQRRDDPKAQKAQKEKLYLYGKIILDPNAISAQRLLSANHVASIMWPIFGFNYYLANSERVDFRT